MVIHALLEIMETLTLLPLGESLTADHYSYRLELQRALEAIGVKVEYRGTEDSGNPDNNEGFDSRHAGFPGAPIRTVIIPWVKEHLTPESAPDVILLWIGVNDTAWAHANYSKGQTSLGDLAELVNLITQRAPDSHLLLGSIPPFDPDAHRWPEAEAYEGACERATAYNQGMKMLAESLVAKGHACAYVDVGSCITPEVYALRDKEHPDGNDGIHLGTTGNSLVAKVWLTALKDVLAGNENLR